MGEMRHTFTLDAVPEGTRLTQEGRLEPNVLGRIMWPMMKGQMAKRFRTIASELDAYLQGK